jgi:hypothetical protein
MSRPGSRLLPLAGGTALLAVLAGSLVLPGRFLATRDVVQFHLPLKVSFDRLLAHGLPEWNPWIAGGQPVLSDPSYAVFYPATWLAVVFPPAYGLALFALAHLGLALAGSWRLLRALGCRPSAAALGAAGFAAGGVVVSFASALNHLPGAAWLPWILLASHRLTTAPDSSAARRATLTLAALFALTLLNGEPVTTICGGLAAGAMALGAPGATGAARFLGRVASAAVLASLLAAVQLLPALGRLADSRRAAGLSFEESATWSLPPARAAELIVPRILGDPARSDDGLWFGWGVHDRDFPFLPAIYPGLAVVLLGLTGMVARRIPARRAWTGLCVAGTVLALGRHTPLWALLHEHVPPFGGLRYPEKFALLPAAALAFAAALTLERWLAERESGRRGEGDLPVALAFVSTVLAGAAYAFVRLLPDRVEAWVAAHSGVPPGPRLVERALALYRGETLAAFAVALLTCVLFLLLRRPRPAAGPIAGALLLLVGAELGLRHRALLPTLPTQVLAPPPVTRSLEGVPGRIFATATFDRRPDLQALVDAPGRRRMEARLARLEPWAGVIWGIPYALTEDFAATFTSPLRRALGAAQFLSTPQDSERFYRLLGAWGAAHTVVRTDPERIARAIAGGDPPPEAATLRTNPWALPTVRYLAAAESFATPREALDAALAAGLPLAEREFVVGGGWRGSGEFVQRRHFAGFEDLGDRIGIGLEPGGRTLLVVANTFDPGWRATVDGAPAEMLETAAGYQALVVPAGATRVELEYRDARVRAGAAASLIALLVGVALLRRSTAR